MAQSSQDADLEAFRQATHELNNLVAVLMGHVDALSRALEGTDPRRKHLESLQETLARSENVARRISLMASGQDAAQMLEAARPSDEKSALRGTETILLVDDEVSLRGVTGRFISMNGYKVMEAANAQEALAAFDKAPVDILVTDMMMSGVGGVDLARRLRARKPDLKVVFLSGHSADEMRRQAGDAVPADFITKPFRPKDLLSRLRDILDSGCSARG